MDCFPPQTKLREGKVLHVCHSVQGEGGVVSLPVWSHVPSRGGEYGPGGYGPTGGVWYTLTPSTDI